MISRARYFINRNTVPYHNLAVEEYLLHNIEPDECILLLWQNSKTVVVGRNQNAAQECRVRELEKENGYLARRLSGGGAVYQSLGNLNFSFIADAKNYDVERQFSVIIRALEYLGVHAERAGRNDLHVNGLKVSGNAYYSRGKRRCHHGCILLNEELNHMDRYLTASGTEHAGPGFFDIRRSVINLVDVCPSITMDQLQKAIVKAFEERYGLEPEKGRISQLEPGRIRLLILRHASAGWKYGASFNPDRKLRGAYPWGTLEIHLGVSGTQIAEVKVFTSALETNLAPELENVLKGLPCGKPAMLEAVENSQDRFPAHIYQDITTLINHEEL